MVKKSSSINLAKTDTNKLTNQVVNWALTIGRVLIIIVELIALSAFIYRFILDNQLRDIDSKIKLEQEILGSQQQKESIYRNLQDRLNLAASINSQAKEKATLYTDIIGLSPQGISLTDISYSKDTINIQMHTSSVFPLSTFVTALKNYSQTDTISIDLIENKATTSLINVGLTINLKSKGGTNANTGN